MFKFSKLLSLENMALLLLITGIIFAGEGIYIKAKAMLAQVLLEQAWQETLTLKESDQTFMSDQIKPWPWADTWPVAELSVPEHSIKQIVLAGTHGESLAFGPAHLTGTALPGESGNIIISGHRDTHFAFLEQMQQGQTITLSTGDISQSYSIEANGIIDINVTPNIPIDQEDKLILITCYPFDAIQAGGPLRYMLIAKPIPLQPAPSYSSKNLTLW